jgi:parvulin-like peptidyl-prolyl isomerase
LKRNLAAAGAIALVLAACSSGSDVVATVNGTEIGTVDVEGLLFETGDDFGDAEFTAVLESLIQSNAFTDAANADFGIEASSEEIAAEVDRLHVQEGAGMTFEEYLAVRNFSAKGLDLYATRFVIASEVFEELNQSMAEQTESEAQRLLADDPMSWTEVCASHILVASLEDADVVRARLDQGEEFAAVAIETSIDTGTGPAGGDLGCAIPSNYVPEFAQATMTAELGQISAPVETQFGFHLIRVDSRREATVEEIQTALVREAVNNWYLSSLNGAEISVDKKWGTWETEPQPGIVPPSP